MTINPSFGPEFYGVKAPGITHHDDFAKSPTQSTGSRFMSEGLQNLKAGMGEAGAIGQEGHLAAGVKLSRITHDGRDHPDEDHLMALPLSLILLKSTENR